MQLTTLLDTVYQGVATTGADDFDLLVAGLVPCRSRPATGPRRASA